MRIIRKIKKNLGQDFFKNYIVITLSVLSFILNIASFVILIIFIRTGNSTAILHYNVYFGVDIIGNWWQTYLNPLMGFLIMLVNFCLAFSFYKRKERIASYVLLLASFMIQFGLVITSVTVALINY